MRFFSKTKKASDLVAVFDVSSSSVGGMLLLRDKANTPKILFSVREPVLYEENVSIEKLFSETLRSLSLVADALSKQALGAPSKIFCILSSPWHISETRIIRVQKDTPFVFTEKLSESLLAKEVDLLKEEYSKKYAYVGTAIRPIELKNVRIMLNGYETTRPLHQSTKDLEMTLFISLSAEDVCKQIEQLFVKRLSVAPVQFSSFTLASFAVVRDIHVQNDMDFLLIHISGEVTEISIVKNNVLHESGSFPLGSNSIVRNVFSSASSNIGEAKSLVSLLKDDHAGDTVKKALNPALLEARLNWLHKFEELLASLSHDVSIPSLIYLTTTKDNADFFAEIITNEQFSQYTLTESKFRIVLLDVTILHGMSQFGADAAFDPLFAINSIYINRFLN